MKQEDKAGGTAHVYALLPGSPWRLFAQECQHCSSYQSASVRCRCVRLTVQGVSSVVSVREWPIWDVTPCSYAMLVP
jgi:hypothetical protein